MFGLMAGIQGLIKSIHLLPTDLLLKIWEGVQTEVIQNASFDSFECDSNKLRWVLGNIYPIRMNAVETIKNSISTLRLLI